MPHEISIGSNGSHNQLRKMSYSVVTLWLPVILEEFGPIVNSTFIGASVRSSQELAAPRPVKAGAGRRYRLVGERLQVGRAAAAV